MSIFSDSLKKQIISIIAFSLLTLLMVFGFSKWLVNESIHEIESLFTHEIHVERLALKADLEYKGLLLSWHSILINPTDASSVEFHYGQLPTTSFEFRKADSVHS